MPCGCPQPPSTRNIPQPLNEAEYQTLLCWCPPPHPHRTNLSCSVYGYTANWKENNAPPPRTPPPHFFSFLHIYILVSVALVLRGWGLGVNHSSCEIKFIHSLIRRFSLSISLWWKSQQMGVISSKLFQCFINLRGQSHKTASINNNFWREMSWSTQRVGNRLSRAAVGALLWLGPGFRVTNTR